MMSFMEEPELPEAKSPEFTSNVLNPRDTESKAIAEPVEPPPIITTSHTVSWFSCSKLRFLIKPDLNTFSIPTPDKIWKLLSSQNDSLF